jgi:hypothetical protein
VLSAMMFLPEKKEIVLNNYPNRIAILAKLLAVSQTSYLFGPFKSNILQFM